MEFKITKEQILEFVEWGNSKDQEKVKQWFPEAFEMKLEVGRWYKATQTESKSLVFVTNLAGSFVYGYGFDFNGYYAKDDRPWDNNLDKFTPATDSEVEAALIKEAKKRGFKEGVYFKTTSITRNCFFVKHSLKYEPSYNILLQIKDGEGQIFNSGKWAEIIPTMTQQEAEEKLGCKIV